MARRLTKKERGFANDYIQTGNGTQSALKNYDTKDYFTAASIAHQNLKKLQIQQYIADKASDASAMVYKLSQEAEAEAIRLSASKDILDRAGFKPIEKSQSVNLNLNETIPSEELKSIAERLNELEKNVP